MSMTTGAGVATTVGVTPGYTVATMDMDITVLGVTDGTVHGGAMVVTMVMVATMDMEVTTDMDILIMGIRTTDIPTITDTVVVIMATGVTLIPEADVDSTTEVH